MHERNGDCLWRVRCVLIVKVCQLSQVWAWYKVSDDTWQLLLSKTRRRYREFITLQLALEANAAFSSSLTGIYHLILTDCSLQASHIFAVVRCCIFTTLL